MAGFCLISKITSLCKSTLQIEDIMQAEDPHRWEEYQQQVENGEMIDGKELILFLRK